MALIKMLSGVVSDKTVDLIKQGVADTTYIQHNWSYHTRKELSDKIFQSMRNQYMNQCRDNRLNQS